jgi:poly-D-alanine transfer protein DltD
MKKDKLKALVKSARKSTTETIKLTLITQLKETAEKLGIASKKTTKEIEKSAKNLAKKLSAEIKIDKDAIAQAAAETKTAPVGVATPVTEKPAKQAPAKPKAEKKAELA